MKKKANTAQHSKQWKEKETGHALTFTCCWMSSRPPALASFIQEDKPVICKALLWILFLKLSFGVGNSTPRA